MKTKVYNLEGKASGEIELSDAVFAVKVKPEVVHEVLVAQAGNRRQPWAHTKTRGQVRGGGRKPWAQKGTGRARHGSIRSPLWKGGGVTFGPLSTRNYKSKINKKTRRLALKMCLTDLVKEGNLLVLEDYNFSAPKTKLLADLLSKLAKGKKSFLLLTDGKDEKVLRMSNNLEKVGALPAQDLNVLDLLNKQVILINKAGLAKLEELLQK